MPNYRRANTPGACYFFTVVTFRRRPILTDDDCRVWLRNAVSNTRKKYPFNVDAWVLLSDHLHCIWILPADDNDFSIRWSGIKRRFTTSANHSFHKAEWANASRQKHREATIGQRRFWEHEIRDKEDYQRHMDYIHYNPVKHGLVNKVVDWSHSTFHRYVKQGIYSTDWGDTTYCNDTMKYGE